MKTTVLVMEFLFAGVLILLALALLAVTIFPELPGAFKTIWPSDEALSAVSAILAIPMAAIAYGVGLISEFVAGEAFEWWLTRIKRVRLTKYLRENRAKLRKSPILAEYTDTPPEQIKVTNEETALMGVMRFHILMESHELYQEVESQLNRFRLIRVLFLVELILAVAIVWQLFRNPSSAVLACSLALVLALVVANIFAIKRRFDRYCRAVERSYQVLVLDAPQHSRCRANAGKSKSDDD